MRIGQERLTSPSFNSDYLIRHPSPGICNPQRSCSHGRFPSMALRLWGFSCSWLKGKHRSAGPPAPERVPGVLVKQLLSAFPLTPRGVAQGPPSSRGLLKFLSLFSFRFKVHGVVDSLFSAGRACCTMDLYYDTGAQGGG